MPGRPWALHQLRHSALTHAAEEGASTSTPLAYSGHTSVASLCEVCTGQPESAAGRLSEGPHDAGRSARATGTQSTKVKCVASLASIVLRVVSCAAVGEPGIASVPAPRAAPRDCSPAAGRLVTGLSRVSCRDARGLAVLMGTGRRAGLPGVSRLAAPAPPLSRLWRITGPGRQTGIFSRRPIRRTRPARRRRRRIRPGSRRLQPPPAAGGAGGRPAAGSRAAGQVAAAGRAGLPTVLRCRRAWV